MRTDSLRLLYARTQLAEQAIGGLQMLVMAKKKAGKADPEATKQVLVRMPQRLYDELEKDAEEESRTVNMHIVWLVKERLKTIRQRGEQ